MFVQTESTIIYRWTPTYYVKEIFANLQFSRARQVFPRFLSSFHFKHHCPITYSFVPIQVAFTPKLLLAFIAHVFFLVNSNVWFVGSFQVKSLPTVFANILTKFKHYTFWNSKLRFWNVPRATKTYLHKRVRHFGIGRQKFE